MLFTSGPTLKNLEKKKIILVQCVSVVQEFNCTTYLFASEDLIKNQSSQVQTFPNP
jgi:hypothetical protein